MLAPSVEDLITESSALYKAVYDLLADAGIYLEDRAEACNSLCSMSFEHGASILTLTAHGYNVSAAGMVRLQFEALVRAMWVWFVASDHAVAKFIAPLSKESLQAAKNLPGINEMLKALSKSEDVPRAMLEALEDFQRKLLNELHSLVHSGLLPLSLYKVGVPESIQIKTIKHSNGLVMLAGAMMGFLTGVDSIMAEMNKIPPRYKSCLPELVKYREQS